jgi:hypothetical protein
VSSQGGGGMRRAKKETLWHETQNPAAVLALTINLKSGFLRRKVVIALHLRAT